MKISEKLDVQTLISLQIRVIETANKTARLSSSAADFFLILGFPGIGPRNPHIFLNDTF